MTEPIRVLHFADIHIGMENYGRLDPSTGTSTRVRDFLDRMDEVIEYALENDADLAVFAGDAFKNRDPDPTQQREFAHRIKRLADSMPVLLVVGNHDMPGIAARASSVDIFQALAVPGVIVGNKISQQVVNTKRGSVYLAWMPYPMRNRLLSNKDHHGKSIEELNKALKKVVTENLQVLAEDANSHSMPRILAGHFSVDKAHYGSERSVLIRKEISVQPTTLADPAWDYVALGHIHRHQDISDGIYPPVVYSGSLERIDFGEEKEQKGFCWVELLRGETKWKFIPVEARSFKTIRVDVRGAEDPTDRVLKKLEDFSRDGVVFRIQIQMEDDQQAAFREREIHNALDSATSVTVSKDIEDKVRPRLYGQSLEAYTQIELVEKYLHFKNVAPDRIRLLLGKVEEILSDSN